MEGFRLRGDALAAFGQRPALISASHTLSYAELALRAAAVWRALRRLNILPGSNIALLSSGRAFDEAIALTGILTSGSVAIPLDAHAPPYRLSSIITQRRCSALIADEKASGTINSIKLEENSTHLIVLDAEGHVLRTENHLSNSHSNPNELNELNEPPGKLACILHTSGSTGTPKAIPITWAGLDAFTSWAINTFSIQSNDRLIRIAELIFDLAWFDHLCAFRVGAPLLLPSRRDLLTGAAFRDALRTLGPTILYGVPSLFMKLNAALAPDALLEPQPRSVLYAGEAFPHRELLAFSKRVPQAGIYNLFGPTETNVCTYHRIDHAALDRIDGQSEIPIGKACPYAACELRSLDEAKTLIEGPGTGELWVSGPTALHGGPHATGDRVERKEDGLFYFRGRVDQMTKIRGYRVEPAEIESVLCAYPGVRQTAVIAIDDPKFGKVLRAAIEPSENAQPLTKDMLSERAVRMFIAERLPAYMVPDRIFFVDALPRTSTGKIDYQALRERLS